MLVLAETLFPSGLSCGGFRAKSSPRWEPWRNFGIVPRSAADMPFPTPSEFAKEKVLAVQDYSLLAARSLSNLVGRPRYLGDTLQQADSIGVGSLPIVVLTGFFTGAVLALQRSNSLRRFGSLSLIGELVALSMVRELGPVLTALMVAGRNASGMASELGSMKVTEQIDAIETSAVSPYRLLAAPRILACILVLPLLTLAADASGLLMGWVAQALVEPLSLHQFINAGFKGAAFNDFLPPTFKTMAFGLIIGVIACFQGMRTRGGAAGVGRAATSSVVLSSLFVILADVVLVKLIIIFFP